MDVDLVPEPLQSNALMATSVTFLATPTVAPPTVPATEVMIDTESFGIIISRAFIQCQTKTKGNIWPGMDPGKNPPLHLP